MPVRVKLMSFLAVAAALLAAAPMARAQNTPDAKPLPGLDDFSLPSSRPTRRPIPSPEPTISALPRREAPADAPSAQPVAPPQVVPTIRAVPTPTPIRPRAEPVAKAPSPTPTATPAHISAPTPTPTPTPVPALLPSPPARSPVKVPTHLAGPAVGLLLGGAAGAFALAALAGWWWRPRTTDRRSRRDPEPEQFPLDRGEGAGGDLPSAAPAPTPVAAPSNAVPAIEPVATADARAVLDVVLTVKRAGTNVLSAAIDYVIVVRNVGESAATEIRLDVRLLSAGQQQDAAIAALFSTPIAQPLAAPFVLPPGGAVELSGMAMHPKQTLEVMQAAGRVLFVPVLTVNLTYDWVGGSGQTARSYVIGIDRGATAKLQPFRLDAPPRMYDTVAALPYPIAETR